MSSSRRSRRQTRRKSRTGRVVGFAFGGIVLVLVLGVLGGYLWLTGYLGSEKFRLLVNERASAAIGAEVTASRFLWDGMLVKSPSIAVRGAGLLESADIEGLETEVRLGSLLRKKLESGRVHVDRVAFSLDATKELPPRPPDRNVEFPGLVVDESTGVVSFGGPALKWDGARMEVLGGAAGGSYEIMMSGGRVETPVRLFPVGTLRELKARSGAGRLYLTKAEFGVYESGRLDLTGEVALEDGRYSVEGKLSKVYGREMVPEDWKKRLEGTLSSKFTVRGRGKRAPVVKGNLEMLDGVLTGLPVFDRLAAYADTTRFRRLVLSEARLDYRQEGRRLELREIVLASEGLLRVEGDLDVVEGNLDGEFRIGLTPGTLARIPGAETRVFLPGGDGLLWSTVRITGTLEDPKEDLSRRLIAAAGMRMFEMLPESGEQVLRHTQRRASEMAAQIMEKVPAVGEVGTTVVEQGAGVIKSGADVVTDGLNSAWGLVPGFTRPRIPPRSEELEEAEEVEEDEETTSSP